MFRTIFSNRARAADSSEQIKIIVLPGVVLKEKISADAVAGSIPIKNFEGIVHSHSSGTTSGMSGLLTAAIIS